MQVNGVQCETATVAQMFLSEFGGHIEDQRRWIAPKGTSKAEVMRFSREIPRDVEEVTEAVNTAAVPVTDYSVITKCGRNFSWAATDMNDLFRQLQEKGYKAEHVRLMSEYEAEIHAQEEQERESHEFREQLERELKESA